MNLAICTEQDLSNMARTYQLKGFRECLHRSIRKKKQSTFVEIRELLTELVVLRRHPVEVREHRRINVSHAIKRCLGIVQDLLAFLLITLLKLEQSLLRLDVNDRFSDARLLSGFKLLNHSFEIANRSFFLSVLTGDHHSEMRELEEVDLRLEVGDEVVVELYQSISSLKFI